MIVQWSRLLILSIFLHKAQTSKKLCCCPSLRLALRCDGLTTVTDHDDATLGLQCTVANNTNVKFSCQLDDLYDKSIVTSVTYLFAGDVSLSKSLPLPLETKSNLKLQEGPSDKYTFTAEEGTSPGVLQCLAKVGLADGSEAWVVSNSLLLDIQYQPTYADEIAITEKTQILVGARKTILECTMPASNPPTVPVWKFKGTNAVDWVVLKEDDENMTPSRLARLAVDQSDLKGDLYVMFYDKNVDDGEYACFGGYSSPVVEDREQQIVSYKTTGTNINETESAQMDIIYQSSAPLFVSDGGNVSYTVQARDANITALKYSWSMEDPTTGILGDIDPSAEGFWWSNLNRKLTVKVDYDLYGSKFKCRVIGIQNHTTQYYNLPIIKPKNVSIPTGRHCSLKGSNVTATVNTDYMMDTLEAGMASYKQLLPGSEYSWILHNKTVSPITNQKGKTSDTKVIIWSGDVSKWVDENVRCIYFSRLARVDSGYQILQTVNVERPPEEKGCDSYSITEEDVMINCTNKEDQIVVQLPPTARCVSVVVRGENGTEVPSTPHYFSPVVETGETCQGRELTANLWKPTDLVNPALVIRLNEEQLLTVPITCAAICSRPVTNATITPDTAVILEGASYTLSCPGEGWVLNGGTAKLVCGTGGKLVGGVGHCIQDGHVEPVISGGLSTGAIVAIVVVAVLAVTGVAVAAFLVKSGKCTSKVTRGDETRNVKYKTDDGNVYT